MTHPWKSSGDKRTVWWYYEPSPTIMYYLSDMRDAIRYGVTKSYLQWKSNGTIPSPIDLRKYIKPWFYSNYGYAKHHINPVCRSSVSILRSFRKNHRNKRYPQVNRLAMRLDSELVKIVDGRVRITMRPGQYEFIPINTRNKKWEEYSKHKIGEVLITDRIISISFSIPDRKEISGKKIGMDTNFSNITGTVFDGGIKEVIWKSTSSIGSIQNDFSRRRRELQKHVRNQEKRNRKMKRTRGRERNRINDAMHKLSSSMVKEHPDASFILEDLSNIRKTSRPRSKKMRTHLNRWPYSEFQRMIEYKSRFKTIYVNPGGTSSECPVCGGRLKHPAWKISRCYNCGKDYDRDRLSSLAITLRGLHLCGDPFPVSAKASLPSVMDEYLYVGSPPETAGAGGTEMVYASNNIMHNNA
ncbi:MAG: transposase [Thermoplasmatales archaeon]|nr:transposase [Candidatus Thermoplasmatota archaeon]MDA8055552.1 transposase [Thermoplasmatales archaeon]